MEASLSPPAVGAPDDAVVSPREVPTVAPVVGEVLDTFASRLDACNPRRLPTLCGDAGALGPFWVAAASCAGLSHLHKARTAQDSYSFALADDEAAVVVAVADGLGSRPTSAQVGAVALARWFCAALARHPSATVAAAPVETVGKALAEANDELRALREHIFAALEDDDLSTTLAFCWIPVDYASTMAVAGRVGDAAAFTLTGETYTAVFPTGEGPLNVVSASLPSPRPVDALEIEFLGVPEKGAVILATDGVAEDLYGSPTVRTWLAERWSLPCGPYWMLDSLRYRRRGSHDDRTALVVWLAATTPEAARRAGPDDSLSSGGVTPDVDAPGPAT